MAKKDNTPSEEEKITTEKVEDTPVEISKRERILKARKKQLQRQKRSRLPASLR